MLCKCKRSTHAQTLSFLQEERPYPLTYGKLKRKEKNYMDELDHCYQFEIFLNTYDTYVGGKNVLSGDVENL